MSDNKGRLYRDADDHKVQVPTKFQTKDGSGTPKQSPLSIIAASETVVVIPEKCKQIIVRTDENIWVDAATGVGSSQGCLIDTQLPIVLPVNPGDSIYFKADTSTATVSITYLLLS